jgi:hypothetical protein
MLISQAIGADRTSSAEMVSERDGYHQDERHQDQILHDRRHVQYGDESNQAERHDPESHEPDD